MRPKEIPDVDVVEAGKRLRAAGRAITGYALRREVGGAGSAARLAAVWAQFQASEQVTEATPSAQLPVEVASQLSGLLDDVTARITALAHSMNDTAVSASERRVAELVRSVAEQRQQAEREIADADQAVGELEASLEQEKQARAELEAQLQEQNRQIQAKDIELARLGEKHQADRDEIERTAARAQQFEADVTRLERELAEARSIAATAREDAAGVRGELRGLQQQNEQLLQRLGKAT